MNAPIESLNRWSQLWLDAMAGLLWQSTLLALAVAAVCWMLRRHSPALRYGLWLVLSAKLLAMPFWSINVEGPPWLPVDPVVVDGESPDSAESSAASGASPALAVVDPALDNTPSHLPAAAWQVARPYRLTWRSCLLLTWLAVVFLAVVRTAWQFIRLKRVLVGARPVAGEVKALVGECAGAIGLRKPPLALQVDGDSSPLVCGLLRPVLLLPASQANRFDRHALRQIILHELAHLRRRDLWTIWLIHAMRTVYWFHPVAHWMGHRAGLERELACDQLAMTHSGASAAAYARTLIQAACRSSQPMALSAAGAARLDGGEALFVMEESR